MPTLEQMLNDELGLAEATQEKVASKDTPETDEIEKIATDLGLFGDDKNNNNLSDIQTEEGHKKEAQMSGLTSLYQECFPDDANLFDGQEKVASVEKNAAETERLMGEYSHDCFVEAVDSHITKIAEEMTGDATLDGEPGDPHPQGMENNYEGDNKGEGAAIDTKPDHSDGEKAMGTSPEGAVGDFEGQASPDGEQKQAALRKHFLLAQLED